MVAVHILLNADKRVLICRDFLIIFRNQGLFWWELEKFAPGMLRSNCIMRVLMQIMDYDGLLIRFAANQWCYHVEDEKESQRLVEMWFDP